MFKSVEGYDLNKNVTKTKIGKQIRPSPEALTVLNSAKGSVVAVQSTTAVNTIVSLSI